MIQGVVHVAYHPLHNLSFFLLLINLQENLCEILKSMLSHSVLVNTISSYFKSVGRLRKRVGGCEVLGKAERERETL